jgi:hypothetical protein
MLGISAIFAPAIPAVAQDDTVTIFALAAPTGGQDDIALGAIRFDAETTVPIYFEPPAARADGSTRFFLWPSEESVDGATRLLIGQTHERYDEEVRVMTEVMLGQRDTRKYNSTLKEMVLAPLALKAMMEPKVDFFGIPASCHGKASFSGAYAGCALKW